MASAATALSPDGRAPWSVRAGLMVTALTVLVSQIALTRVMSVSVNYHAAFLILAVVMLGMAASAVSAYLGMRRADKRVTVADSVTSAYRSAIAAVVALIGFVVLVARDWGPLSQPLQLLVAPALFFSWFYYSGYVVALVLSHFARDMARLYWFDLVGAAGGCMLVVPLLNRFSALSVILLCAAGMAISGALLARALGTPRIRRTGALLSAAMLTAWAATIAWPGLLRLHFAKGQDQSQVVWERWNAQARVSVTPEIPGTQQAVELYQRKHGVQVSPEELEEMRLRHQAGWGLSRKFPGRVPPALWVQLDTDAGTPIIQDGVAALDRPGELDFLAWDVTSAGYVCRANSGGPLDDVFIVGGGGGRDVLAALSFKAGRVDVVELNRDVVKATQEQFGNYGGQVYSHPRVRLTIGEARGELSRRDDRYDLIQMSMIDTWASSMAGSMVMSENNLYTQEAFDLYVSRLKGDGVLSVTRWFHPVRYGESARIVVLMSSALRRAGVERPEDHVALMTTHGSLDTALATALLKRSPFTDQERTALQQLARERGYGLLWPREPGADVPFDAGALLRAEPSAINDPNFDLSPPTDDRPFFFNIDWPLASWAEAIRSGDMSRGSRATLVLGAALIVMCGACVWFVIRPLRASGVGSAAAPKAFVPPLLYFGGIGLGFMLVELALIQRYILFLGHPSYAISVVLFALLLFGGFGSLLTAGIDVARLLRTTRLALVMVLAGTVLTAIVVPDWLARVAGWSWGARVAIAIGLIAPQALFMGMIFPLGVRRLTETGREDLVPWMWGVNGVCGVVALVLGMLLAMNLSYTTVLLTGAVAYGVTLLSLSLPLRVAVGKSEPAEVAAAAV
jgi:spermidine synthase